METAEGEEIEEKKHEDYRSDLIVHERHEQSPNVRPTAHYDPALDSAHT